MGYKEKRRFIFAISLLILSFLYFFSRYNVFFMVFGSIFSLILFYLGDHLLKWDLKFWHYLAFFGMVVLGFILMPLYFVSSSIDKYQHFFFPIITCFLIYHVIDNMLDLPRKWKLGITLSILISLITAYEAYEYIADFFWNVKLQGVYSGSWIDQKFTLIMPRIDDTMVDIMLGIAGGFAFVFGKVLFKKSNKTKKSKKSKR
jgi:hypothetical protein